MRITVFTPTYNRAHIIEKLYRSLQAQTFHDFEWLVIDDGSSDHTDQLFLKWMKEDNPFKIRYVYAENKGKMKELNYAMDLAVGELFFTVDSDDALTSDALEKIDIWERTIPQDGGFCGLAGSMGYNSVELSNPRLPGEYYDASLFQRYQDNGKEYIGADRAWVFYTNVYRTYKFPEFEGEKFIAEAVVWNRMAHDGLKIRCFNDVIYVFEHQEGGLTDVMSQTLIRSPRGYGLWQAEMMRFMNYSLKRRLKQYYIFYCDLMEKHSTREIASYIQCPICVMMALETVYRLKHRRRI
ncbi:glycosyltransferase family A protein [Frisingicoccus sp.]|uniref:glycosyltransferase family A protein n=1 Tax=Frisingicoccus sp. TaxID=1918627 RepID=UPI0025C48422|nr:glycosyltransferase family A protein [Frisingicoccus sp.]